MTWTRVSILPLIVGVVVSAACTGATLSSGSPASSDTRPIVSPLPATSGPLGATLPEDLAAAIIEDAAATLGVDPSEVAIVSAEATTWNDGSLGCPEPGVMYTQALIDGYGVIVGSADEQLDYRTGNGGSFKRCEGFQPGG